MNDTYRRAARRIGLAGLVVCAGALWMAAEEAEDPADDQPATGPGLFVPGAGATQPGAETPASAPADSLEEHKARLRAALKDVPWKILYESYRNGNWELMRMNADGSEAVNLTNNPRADEMFPHASPDGSKICFVMDERAGRARSRSVYYMNADGTGRTLVSRNGRQPCWSPDGGTIAFLPGEYERFTDSGYATKGMAFYDLKTGKTRVHPDPDLLHLYALCWSPDGKWLHATVEGGMGYRHANLVIEADGPKHYVLPAVEGCRQDITPDGRHLVWNHTDQAIAVADLDPTTTLPNVTNVRHLIECQQPYKVYHSEWSPDGKYLLFSHGLRGSQAVGQMARGWHIGVVEVAHPEVVLQLTTDGVSNKEADWVPVPPKKEQ